MNMKAHLMAFSTLILATSVFASDCPTLEDVRASYEKSLQVLTTNKVAANNFARRDVLIPLNSRSRISGADADALAAEIDAKYAEVGIEGQYYWATATNDTRFPKCSMLQFKRLGVETNSPYVVALARRKCRNCVPWCYDQNSASVVELVGLLNENINLVDGKCRIGYGYGSVDQLRQSIQSACVRPVKKYLRSQGKSFVTKDGVNPCEEIMSGINTALNAPYFDGLNAWFAKIGIDASVDVSHLPTSSEVEDLKNKILDADKDMNKDDAFVLKVCLGIEGYNSFVKEYNGEN